MARFEGRCRLDREWWANSSTCFGPVEIDVVIEADGSDWIARGRLAGPDDADPEGFLFLCELDPVFTMRFDGEGTVPVVVHDIEEAGRRFALTECRGPGHRPGHRQIHL